MSGRYGGHADDEAHREYFKDAQKIEIKAAVGSHISAKYNEFILLQYQLHCDEFDVCNIIIADDANQHNQQESFLLHCQERRKYCCNQIMLLGKAFPDMHKARFASHNRRI